jgi:hypothetical protein
VKHVEIMKRVSLFYDEEVYHFVIKQIDKRRLMSSIHNIYFRRTDLKLKDYIIVSLKMS